MSDPALRGFGLSRRGDVRPRNEDRFLIRRVGRGLLAAVADGVGVGRGGGNAATLAMRSLRAMDEAREPRDALVSRVLSADLSIRAARNGHKPLERMCCTLTAVYIKDGRAVFVHVGDSRLYLVREGRAVRLTRDHTVLQTLVESGGMTEAQADVHPRRNELRLCLGCPYLEPDVDDLNLAPGDVLLLCTDGLYGAVAGEDLARLGEARDLRGAVRDLAGLALRRSGKDNVTLIAVRE
ncbi:PP2C family protein-serine/threonine phosphatase [Desulfocurvus sp. DL9XJH121]